MSRLQVTMAGVRFSPGSYQMTMATIFKTASFKLWQKLTKALPLGPIRPSMIPEFRRGKGAAFQLKSHPDVPNAALNVHVRCCLTHGGGKNDDPQHVHAFAGAGRRLHDDVRRRREIQREVLHIGAVVVLDAVYVDPACGGLVQQLRHSGFGDELGDSLGPILDRKKGPAALKKTAFYGQQRLQTGKAACCM